MTNSEIKEKELSIFQDIHRKTINLKERFESYVNSIIKDDEKIKKFFEDNDIVNIMKSLIFGVDDNLGIKKVDFAKNKNLLKKVFISLPNFYNTLSILKNIFIQLDEYIWYVDKTIYTELYNNDLFYSTDNYNPILNDIEIIRFMNILDVFKNETTYIRSTISELKNIVYSTCNMNKDDFLENANKIKSLKKDSLKRYYFTDVYEIKDGLKYFYTDGMFFGETNSIMHYYKKIIEFIFCDFCAIYNTIENNVSEIIKNSTK